MPRDQADDWMKRRVTTIERIRTRNHDLRPTRGNDNQCLAQCFLTDKSDGCSFTRLCRISRAAKQVLRIRIYIKGKGVTNNSASSRNSPCASLADTAGAACSCQLIFKAESSQRIQRSYSGCQ